MDARARLHDVARRAQYPDAGRARRCWAGDPLTIFGGRDGVNNALTAMGTVPVIITHGTADGLISIEEDRAVVPMMQARGMR